MKTKWYISVLIIILTILGVSQDHVSGPNQQIIVHFTNGEASSLETQNALKTVKGQLLALGVNNITVQQQTDGLYKISYYSDVSVDQIKSILSKDKVLELGFTNNDNTENHSRFPSNKSENNYDLNVSEINTSPDVEIDLNGITTVEQNQEYDHSYNSNVFNSFVQTSSDERNNTQKTAYILNRNIALAIDVILYKIPEVRAGPNTQGNI